MPLAGARRPPPRSGVRRGRTGSAPTTRAELVARLAPAPPARPASAGRGRRPPVAGRRGGELVGDGSADRAGRVAELGEGADGGDHPGGPVVEDVVGHRERAARPHDGPQAVQVVLAVVAAHEHLEHRLLVRDAAREPLGEEAHDLLGDGGQRLDPLGAVRRRRGRREAATSSRTPASTLGALLVDSGWSNQRNRTLRARSPTTGKRSWVARDEPLEAARAGPAQLLGRRRLGDPALQQPSDQVDVGGGALLGQEDPEDRLLELRRALRSVDAVVREHAGQPVAELLRQPAAVDVEALQVGCGSAPSSCARAARCAAPRRRAGCG